MKSKLAIILSALVVIATAFTFQNCAKAKFHDPDPAGSAVGLGLCRYCSDATGTGIQCRASTTSAFTSCFKESCNSGYQLQGAVCVAVNCVAGTQGNCVVPHGQGLKTCNLNGQGYGECVATECEQGYELVAGACISTVSQESTPTPTPTPTPEPTATPENPTPTPEPTATPSPTATPDGTCSPGSSRDCSTESTIGTQTCNNEGTSYGACVFDDCQAGYNKDNQTNECVPNTCNPNEITPCTVGAGSGFKTCNSKGSAFGACVINECQQGYNLKDGVCVAQLCTPGSEAVCDFANGTGIKLCNNDGSGYGTCQLLGCQHGYGLIAGKCAPNICEPAAATTCQGESGSGYKYCFENGQGYGACKISACDEGFKLRNGQCVRNSYCDAGETFACTEQNGSGVRTCGNNDHMIGPCVLTACNAGFELVNQGNSPACKKIDNGKK